VVMLRQQESDADATLREGLCEGCGTVDWFEKGAKIRAERGGCRETPSRISNWNKCARVHASACSLHSSIHLIPTVHTLELLQAEAGSLHVPLQWTVKQTHLLGTGDSVHLHCGCSVGCSVSVRWIDAKCYSCIWSE
jgi:hypothetical protein